MHPFFAAQSGDPVMSHNGATVRHTQLGTKRAFRDAFAAGYRWFQIDAIPTADGLVSAHSATGRKRGWLTRTIASFATDPDRDLRSLSSVDEIILDGGAPAGWNTETRWNIEMKYGRGLDQLVTTLRKVRDAKSLDPDPLQRIMVSSPWRPKVLRRIATEFPTVALAAPIQHGGVFGISWWPWGKPDRPYDCEQVHRLFVRKGHRATDAPHQQAWTIRTRAALEKLIERTEPDTGETTWRAWPIVDSRRLTIRPVLDPRRADPPASWQPTQPTDVEALALGGGGWRGAFGGIGTIGYLLSKGAFGDDVAQVVGISGGAFAVAGLAGGVPQETTVGLTLQGLLDRLVSTARLITPTIVGIVAVVLGLLGLGSVGAVAIGGWRLLALTSGPLIACALFVARALVLQRWVRLTKRIFADGAEVMADDPTDGRADEQPRPRRYAIGATGLNDGRLYSFSTTASRERRRCADEQWPAGLRGAPAVVARERAVPLGGWNHAEAVVRASSLPGIGPRAGVRIWLPCPYEHDVNDAHTSACEWVPDRLVDGGLNGIFGRGLLLNPEDMKAARAGGPLPPTQPPGLGPSGTLPVLLTVDTGRALVANNAESFTDRLVWWGHKASTIALEARWLQVAFNISYLAEMNLVYDGAVADGFRLRLVRLAETETDAWPGLGDADQERRDRLQERLFVLRDLVHKISLNQASPPKAYDAIVCAAVACALEFEPVPRVDDDVPDPDGRRGVLQEVETSLGLEGVLVERWRSLKVPMLGQP